MSCLHVLAVLLVVLFATTSSALRSPDPLFGVNPALYELYSKPTVSCQGKGSIPISKVNDDYCDCPEKGEDEPGTSACSNGTFFCKNIGSKAVEIGSWRVNDGICDCCDGSDEFLGFVQCQNICEKEGKQLKELLQSQVFTLKQGLEEKQKLVYSGESLKEKQVKRLAELKSQIQTKQSEVEDRRRQAAEADAAAESDKDSISSPKEKSDSGNSVSDIDTITGDPHPKESESKIDSESPTPSSFPDAEQYNTGEPDEGVPAEESSFPYPEQYAPHKHDEETPMVEKDDDADETSEQRPQETVKQEPDQPESLLMKAAREARQVLKDAEDELSSIKKESEEIDKMLSTDYGPNNAYRMLQSECFSTVHEKYTYKLCPFKDASQIESHSTSLGSYQGWSNNYTEWIFDHGQKCWNGPERSVKVKLQCGLRNQVISVHEPSICVYEMQFETPAACLQDEIDKLSTELRKLTDPEHVHDEL